MVALTSGTLSRATRARVNTARLRSGGSILPESGPSLTCAASRQAPSSARRSARSARCSIRRIGQSRTNVTLERWACLMLSGSLSSRAGERALGATLEEARARAEAQRFREDAAAQREARTKAEIEAQAQAVDDKTARLRSLRLAKEAAEHRAPLTGHLTRWSGASALLIGIWLGAR